MNLPSKRDARHIPSASERLIPPRLLKIGVKDKFQGPSVALTGRFAAILTTWAIAACFLTHRASACLGVQMIDVIVREGTLVVTVRRCEQSQARGAGRNPNQLKGVSTGLAKSPG